MANSNVDIANKIFAYLKHGTDINDDIKEIYKNSLIFIGDEKQIYVPVINTYVGIGESRFKALEGSNVWERGEGELSVQTRDTGSYAKGAYSVAEGQGSMALSNSSHSEGIQTIAKGYGSHTEGYQTITGGEYTYNPNDTTEGAGIPGSFSHAEGRGSIASGSLGAHAEGNKTLAAGDYSHAEGNKTLALKNASHAEGAGTIASGNSSHAEGILSYSYGYASHAEVAGLATGRFSHAEGSGVIYISVTGEENTTEYTGKITDSDVIAWFNKLGKVNFDKLYINAVIYPNNYFSVNYVSRILNFSSTLNGNILNVIFSTDNTLSRTVSDNTLTNLNNTNCSIYSNISYGESSHVEGLSSITYGNYSHAEGYYTFASGIRAHAEGGITIASGASAHAEGYYTQAIANSTHAEGYYTEASANYSHAEGESSKATANASHAEGDSTTASGNHSHAEGYQTSASQNDSHAEGNATTASGASSHAEGESTTASGARGHAEGYRTNANAINSHAEGESTTTSAQSSHAEGENTTASGARAHAEGYATTASNQQAHSEGFWTNAMGAHSHAEGNSTYATASNAHSEGYNTYATNKGAHAEGFYSYARGLDSHAEGSYTEANGDNAHAEGYETKAIGENSHAEGNNTYANGDYSHTEGNNTTASGQGSHAEGYGTIASSPRAHAEGEYTNANGRGSHAEGYMTFSQGAYTHAEGYMTYANGSYTHAEGKGTKVDGEGSHAEGIETIAYGRNAHAEGGWTYAYVGAHAEGSYSYAYGTSSHVEGFNSIAYGKHSHAEGHGTRVIDEDSHAEGSYSYVIGFGSHAEGTYTYTYNSYEHAQGRYNKSHKANDTFGNSGNSIHTIGIGTSNSNRKNAVEVMQNGDIYLYGIGEYDGAEISNSKPLQEYLEDKEFVISSSLNDLHNNLYYHTLDISQEPYEGDENFTYVLSGIYISNGDEYDTFHEITYEIAGLPTKKYVDDLIQANDALRYCGTVSVSAAANGAFTLTHNPNPGTAHADTPDTSRGAVYKITNIGYIGAQRVSPGDIIISYQNNAASNNATGWDIINENVDLRQLPKNSLNDTKVITSVALTNDGTFSYTYSDLAIQNNAAGKSTDGLKTGITGNVNINTNQANNGIPVVTSVSLNQTNATTELSYNVTYLYSSQNHHSIENGNNAGEIALTAETKPIISGINISNDGKISYSYNMYRVESSPTADTVSYLYAKLVSSYTHSVVSIYKDPANNNRLAYSYVNLSTTSGTAKTPVILTNVSKANVINGLTQRGDGKISYSYIEISTTHTQVGVNADNGATVITNVQLSADGKLTYSYNDLSADTVTDTASALTLKNAGTGITNLNVLRTGTATTGVPVITGVKLTQDKEKTTLSYTYSYLYANQSHHSSSGTSSANEATVITSVALSNDGALSYTYTTLSTETTKSSTDIGLTATGTATPKDTLRTASGNTGIPVLTGVKLEQTNDKTTISYAYTYIFTSQSHHETDTPTQGTEITINNSGTNLITGVNLSADGVLSYQYQNVKIGYSASAGKLESSHTFWGQPFDGTQNVSGNMVDIGYAYTSGNVKITKPAYSREFNGVDINTNANHGIKVGIGIGGTNRGILDTDTDTWLIYTNGTGTSASTYTLLPHATRIGSSTNPGAALDVTGEIRSSSKIYVGTSGTSKNAYMTSDNANNIYFSTNSKTTLVLEDNAVRRGISNIAATLGTSANRWANTYSVLGNYSGQITSTLATGTSPFNVTSTTLNTNLNADLLDSEHDYTIRAYSYTESDILFTTLPFIQKKKDFTTSLKITESPAPADAPYGYCFGPITNYTSWNSRYIAVSPGDKLACDMWIYRELSEEAPSKTFYIGLERYDRNLKPISSNSGCVYSGASDSAVPRDGQWHKFTGKWNIPVSHTPYPTAEPVSDGGGVYYVRLRILLNYNGTGGTKSWLGGIKLYRQNSFSSAPSLTDSHTFRVSDNTAAHQGATVSFNGTQDVELKLPSYITVNVEGSASTSYEVKTTRNATNATYYLTFVDSDNNVALSATSPSEKLYTTPNISINPNSGAITGTGLGTFNTIKLENRSAANHIMFTRQAFNYITAPAGGSIAFIANGKSTADASTDLVIQDKLVAPGNAQQTVLGANDRRWAGLYTTTGDFTGQITSTLATGTSPLNVTSTTLNANLNADLLDGYHANTLFESLSASLDGEKLTITVKIGGTTKSTTVNIWGDLSDSGVINAPTQNVAVTATLNQNL